MLCSIIFWGASTPSRSITYTDSLFLVVSAMTLAGLNTINLSTVNTFQQFLLFLLIMLGSAIWVSIAVVAVRRKAFEKRFAAVVEQAKARKKEREGLRRRLTFSKAKTTARPEVDGVVVRGSVIKSEDTPGALPSPKPDGIEPTAETVEHEEEAQRKSTEERPSQVTNGRRVSIDIDATRRITFASPTSPTRHKDHSHILSMQGIGARHNLQNHPLKSPKPIYSSDLPRLGQGLSQISFEPHRNFLSDVFIGRNSQFSNLSLAQREKLGGVEYRALSVLAWVVPLYFFLWQFLGCLGMGAWVNNNRPGTARINGENPWWVGAFNAVSAFNNSGMSLLDANMVAFQTADYMLITMGLLILAGNTCYPVFLRAIIWTMWKLMPSNEGWGETKVTLRFLLDHPRRCYTNLFPSRHTWWLVATLIVLNGIDWIAFEILNIGNSTVTSLPHGARALDGLFQALAVRSGGFYVVPIANLRIGLLILYVIMMYISVYPVVITMRSSNVYEERSLGVYADDPQPENPHEKQQENGKTSSDPPNHVFGKLKRTMTNNPSRPQESRGYFVRQQLRGQLAHDLWWIVLAVLFITITETSQFDRDPVDYSVFNVLFEVVSAYGCVGISVGLPNVAYSFCGGWHVLSKLILCAVMIRGRHRGLPVAIDRAVLLPGEHLAAAEEEDAQIRSERARTMEKGEARV